MLAEKKKPKTSAYHNRWEIKNTCIKNKTKLNTPLIIYEITRKVRVWWTKLCLPSTLKYKHTNKKRRKKWKIKSKSCLSKLRNQGKNKTALKSIIIFVYFSWREREREQSIKIKKKQLYSPYSTLAHDLRKIPECQKGSEASNSLSR